MSVSFVCPFPSNLVGRGSLTELQCSQACHPMAPKASWPSGQKRSPVDAREWMKTYGKTPIPVEPVHGPWTLTHLKSGGPVHQRVVWDSYPLAASTIPKPENKNWPPGNGPIRMAALFYPLSHAIGHWPRTNQELKKGTLKSTRSLNNLKRTLTLRIEWATPVCRRPPPHFRPCSVEKTKLALTLTCSPCLHFSLDFLTRMAVQTLPPPNPSPHPSHPGLRKIRPISFRRFLRLAARPLAPKTRPRRWSCGRSPFLGLEKVLSVDRILMVVVGKHFTSLLIVV